MSHPKAFHSNTHTRAFPTSERETQEAQSTRAHQCVCRGGGQGKEGGRQGDAWRRFLAGWGPGNGEPEQRRENLWESLTGITGFLGGSDGKEFTCNAGDVGSIPGSGMPTPGEGKGNPLQYSCLENPMDRGAWRATVHRITKSWS